MKYGTYILLLLAFGLHFSKLRAQVRPVSTTKDIDSVECKFTLTITGGNDEWVSQSIGNNPDYKFKLNADQSSLSLRILVKSRYGGGSKPIPNHKMVLKKGGKEIQSTPGATLSTSENFTPGAAQRYNCILQGPGPQVQLFTFSIAVEQEKPETPESDTAPDSAPVASNSSQSSSNKPTNTTSSPQTSRPKNPSTSETKDETTETQPGVADAGDTGDKPATDDSESEGNGTEKEGIDSNETDANEGDDDNSKVVNEEELSLWEKILAFKEQNPPVFWGGVGVSGLLLLLVLSRALKPKKKDKPKESKGDSVPPKGQQGKKLPEEDLKPEEKMVPSSKEKQEPVSSKPKSEAAVVEEKAITVKETPPTVVPPPTSEKSIKFKSKKTEKTSADAVPLPPFETLPGHEAYVSFDLTEHWKDTAVEKVFLSHGCMEALDDFITQFNNPNFRELEGAEIPEIGGFLLGRFTPEDQNAKAFEVAIEKFVPISSSDQGVYRIEFGTEAWLELDEVRDQHKHLKTIGWFHTHPGHGLFLSKPDLNIHQGFFKKRYQLALEIDTLSGKRGKGLDTAFFTRTRSGMINNSQARQTDRWFSWDEKMKAVRKTTGA